MRIKGIRGVEVLNGSMIRIKTDGEPIEFEITWLATLMHELYHAWHMLPKKKGGKLNYVMMEDWHINPAFHSHRQDRKHE